MSRIPYLVLVVLLGLALLAGCSRHLVPSDALTSQALSPLATPGPGESASAQPTPNLPSAMLVPFQLVKPLRVGDDEVRGSGPPGVPIVIADVTFMGEILGSGTIGKDGKFAVKLSHPLEAKHRIGVALGDLTDTEWSLQVFQHELFYGEEAMLVPNVGFFYDSFFVNP